MKGPNPDIAPVAESERARAGAIFGLQLIDHRKS